MAMADFLFDTGNISELWLSGWLSLFVWILVDHLFIVILSIFGRTMLQARVICFMVGKW